MFDTKYGKLIFLIVLLVSLNSCSSTKTLASSEYLLYPDKITNAVCIVFPNYYVSFDRLDLENYIENTILPEEVDLKYFESDTIFRYSPKAYSYIKKFAIESLKEGVNARIVNIESGDRVSQIEYVKKEVWRRRIKSLKTTETIFDSKTRLQIYHRILKIS